MILRSKVPAIEKDEDHGVSMILSCQNISKSFGTNAIIKQASFHIEEHEKAAITGINGAGKSTLLKIIIGEMQADEGEVVISRGKSLGYLSPAEHAHRPSYHLRGSHGSQA